VNAAHGLMALLLLAEPAAGPRLLRNEGFDEPSGSTEAIGGWMQQGDQYGRARLARGRVASAPHALELTPIGPGSTGDRSFMLYQVLPHEALRGRKLKFGARVLTEGAGVNLVLFTPEGSANDFDPDVRSGGFRARSGALLVPKNASYLTFGIQVFGPAGGKALVDDAFVQVDDQRAHAEPAPGPSASGASGPSGVVRLAVDAGRVEREVNPWLYCMHIEWVEDGLGLLDRKRPALREEVVSKLRALEIPLFRFPGGIHADYYDWKLGIGPPEQRGQSENVFTGKAERHRFGTPELAALLRATGASALITANFGTGSAEQAGEWASYLAQQKIPAPLWEVGNEIYLSGPKTRAPNGHRIYHSSEEYSGRFALYRQAIQKALPSARAGAIAYLDEGAFRLAPAENQGWSDKMLRGLSSRVDFVATHDAYAPVILDGSNDFATDRKRREAYRSLYAAAEQTREDLNKLASRVDALSPANRGVPLAVTEFGPLFGVSNDPKRQSVFVDQSRTLAAALYVASLLDVFIGHPRVMAACYTNPIHKWYGSLLTDAEGGLVVTPTYHVYELYRHRFYRSLLRAQFEDASVPRFEAARLGLVNPRGKVPEVLGKASRSDDGRRVAVLLVNRSLDRELPAEIALSGFSAGRVDCQVLSASSPSAINGPRLTETTLSEGDIAPRALPCTGRGIIELKLPPSSVVSVVAERS
jgi:alpha-N-arabinofuranosidase